jgi:cell division protein FtsZ
VTKPFQFEGMHRMRLAEAGIEELSAYVDTLIVIPNQNLFRVANEKTTFADAFKMADDVLHGGVRSVTDLMMMPGMINLDFADVRTVMKEMGRAMMGTGEASGDRRALDAAEAAIANPLLEDTSMKGAKGVLINITGGMDITLFEVDEAANRIKDEVDGEAHIIFGSCFDETMEGRIRVSVVATGIDSEAGAQPRPMPVRQETRAVGRRIPEVRTAAPTTRSPVMQPSPAAAQPTFSQFGFGGPTLAPATGTMDLQAEEKALMEMTAAVRMESEAEPVAAAPVAAQAAAVAEAVAKAPQAAPARAPALQRDIFVAKAPVEPRLDARPEPRMEMPAPTRMEPAMEQPRMAAPAPAAPKASDAGRVSLFGRYRSLTSRPKVEELPKAEPQAKIEKPGVLNIAVGPSDRALSAHDEDELEIPAFLRRQAN